MADSVIPHYLETAVVEGGDTRAEVMLCQVEATEKQTEVLERIAVALERISPAREREPFIGELQPDAH